MLTDVDKEFDTPLEDENGELIETIELEEIFEEEDTGLEEKEDSFYETEEDLSEEDSFYETEEAIVEAKENYKSTKEELVEKFTSILEKGEITAEDNVNIEQLKEQYSEAYNSIKENTENVQKKTLEERLEELKEGFVGATIDDILNILTEGGTKTWLYKDDDNNVLMDGTSIPELTVLVNKLNLIAADGEDESSIVLTPLLIQLIAESDIQLSAKKILINGLLEGAGWRIDEEGNFDANDLNIRGNLTCDNINVDKLISDKLPIALPDTMNYHVANGETITQYLDNIPLNLNGYSVNIFLDADTEENLELRRHLNGIINIYFCGHFVKGSIRSQYNNAQYNIFGGATADDTTTLGGVMPYTGYNIGSYDYSIVFINSPNINVDNIIVYGASSSGKSVGIGATNKSKVELNNITFIGCTYNCRTYSMAEVYCNNSKGISSKNSWSAGTGSKIYLGATNQAGGGNNVYTSNNAQIFSNGVTFDTNASSGNNTSTSTPTTTRIETFKPNSLATYRSTVYNNWDTGKARQGNWGYGNQNGCAFYGTQFAEVKGKDITKVTISVKRSSGVGNSGSVSHVFQAHSHTSRPSGAPTFLNCNKTLDLAWDESGTVTITDTDILAKLKTGAIKGFGIKSAFDKAHYSALTNWTVKIYYKE